MIMINALVDINTFITTQGLIALLGILLGFLYWLYKRKEPKRVEYRKFSQAFTPALHRLANPDERADDIMREEFPRHKDAFSNFEHMVRGSKCEIRFKEKWKEYDAKRDRIYKYVWSGAPSSDFPELLESDGVTAKDFNKILKLLIEKLLEIAKP